ncbi:MAG: hypothetical protein PHD21_02795 [Flavobacteriales bacterium]|nr:hypothetical protein [Flavobacteriales bacterium]
MNIKKTILFSIAVLIFASGFTSCKRVMTYITHLENKTANKPLARVGDLYLYRADIPEIVPQGTSTEDSIAIIAKYIDVWATRQLVLSEAQKSISETDLTKEVEEFKELLLQGKYEQSVISQKLDTTITDEQIDDYYTQNKTNFSLNKSIILWSYIPITYCEKDLEKKLRSAFSRDTAPNVRHKKDEDNKEDSPWTWAGSIENILAEESYNVPFVKDQWIEVDKIESSYEVENGFANNVAQRSMYTFTVKKNDNTYLCKAHRYIRKTDIAPKEYVEAQIRSIILNKRKIDVIKQSQDELKKEAIKNNNLEIFTDNENN